MPTTTTRRHHFTRAFSLFVLAGVAMLSLLTAAAASTSGTTSPKQFPKIPPPASIAKSGILTFCSDISYPPEEFFRGSTPVGFDIDIANDLARLMRVKAKFNNIGFDGIIAALQTQKCDATISGMFITPARAKVLRFVVYAHFGEGVLVRTGNAVHVKSLSDLSGKSLSIEAGSADVIPLQQLNKQFKTEGRSPINIEYFPTDAAAAEALKIGKVDTYVSDSPVTAYYTKLSPSSFQAAIPQFATVKVGIAVRNSEADLQRVIQKGVTWLYRSGTLNRIYAKWGLKKLASAP